MLKKKNVWDRGEEDDVLQEWTKLNKGKGEMAVFIVEYTFCLWKKELKQ